MELFTIAKDRKGNLHVFHGSLDTDHLRKWWKMTFLMTGTGHDCRRFIDAL